MWKAKNLLFILLIIFTFFSCKKRVQLPANKYTRVDSSSIEIIELNKLLVEVEQKDIQAYLDTCSLQYKYNKQGFWIAKSKEGSGQKIKNKDAILIQYQVKTIKGEDCYTYTKNLKKQVVVGKLEKQRGFNEALTQLNEGDQASIIVPSNLAYGAMGDTKSIPPRSTLIYTIFTINKIEK